ncbi:MAG: glycosyltransferase family 61 protein [Bradyrhizobium sp.]|nr:glycosyltransferase family 61 protein [Bradyrhizobium sp.]
MSVSLRIREANGVVAVPIAGVNGGGLVIGSSIDEETVFKNRRMDLFDPADCGEPEAQIDETAIFAGYLLPHYGHFLIESLGRIWFAKQRPDLPIVWITRRSGYSPMQREILDILGVRNRPFFVSAPTRLRHLLMPDAGFSKRQPCHPAHAATLGAWPASPPAAGKKLWLSRTRLDHHHAGFTNEPDVEAILQRRGWQIFHPQEHSVSYQLRMLGDAERLAGIEGSAFHTLLLTDRPRARLTIVARRKRLHENFEFIGKAKNLSQRAVRAPFDVIGDKDFGGRKRRATWRSPQQVADAIDAPLARQDFVNLSL